MTDYRTLSDFEKRKVDAKMLSDIEAKHHRNENNGYEWDEPQSTIDAVHGGQYCAYCWSIYYNCVCSHNS